MQNFFQHDFVQYKLTTNTRKNWVVGEIPVCVSTAEYMDSAA